MYVLVPLEEERFVYVRDEHFHVLFVVESQRLRFKNVLVVMIEKYM